MRDNRPELDDWEYMKKKYYSQVVYDAAQAGDLDTSIEESNIDKKAARRLWAGREGTGWGGTGKGGYMESLDAGVGSPVEDEVDQLMQMYLKYQGDKMEQLTRLSHEATYDLFDRVAEQSRKNNPDTTFTNYVPSPKDMGIKQHEMQWYLQPGLIGTPASDATASQKKQWVQAALRSLPIHKWNNPKLKTEYYTSYGEAHAEFAVKLASELNLKGDDYKRLTSLDSRGPRMHTTTGKGKDARSIELAEYSENFKETDANMGKYVSDQDPDAPALRKYPSLSGYPQSDTAFNNSIMIPFNYEIGGKGEGGAFDTQSALGDKFSPKKKLLTSVFEKKSIDDLYPKAFQRYQLMRRIDVNEYFRDKGLLTSQLSPDEPAVVLDSEAEVIKFIKWMEKEVNDELAELNRMEMKEGWGAFAGSPHAWEAAYPQFGAHPPQIMGDIITDPITGKARSPTGKKPQYGPEGPISTSHLYLAGGAGWAQPGKLGWKRGLADHKQEIIEGFLGDFQILGEEFGYKADQLWSYIKKPEGDDVTEWESKHGKWGYKWQKKLDRGKDLYFPLRTKDGESGLVKVTIRATVQEDNTTAPPSKLKEGVTTSPQRVRTHFKLTMTDVQFYPNLKNTLEQEELRTIKHAEGQAAFDSYVATAWGHGASAIYQGAAMMTHAGVGTRMFMGDRTPANSIGFYTSTISTKDFAQRLKDLVDIAAKSWFGAPDGFGGYFNLNEMEGGAFKEWAQVWNGEASKIEKTVNKKIQSKWALWLDQYAGGGATAPPPRVAKSWEGPIKLGPFVHSTKYLGQAQSIGRRPHGYYTLGGTKQSLLSDYA